ncbi:MAG: 3-oxoacyl-ACP reductase FabG [Gammaproteobacteria bacterium]|nr:3-oxoacyl-ACP reductase FabG [Gammaproteobacteria bacterium]MBI5614766.1 3-oxoacyl-ACP reductase FabG [Gammaproteobacteria bacterium]
MSEQRTVLVTGASRGIGKAIAAAFATSGARVVGTATGESGLAAIRGEGHEAFQLDVTSAESVGAFFAALTAAELSPQIVVNNAGLTRDNLLLRMKDEEWREVVDANLTSIFTLCRHFIRPMIKARYGRIVNLTSVVGVAGNAGQANYAAAKAGIIGFTKSLALEVANRGITVNAVAPGMIDTDMTRALTDAQREHMLARIPAGRLGRVEEIAGTVQFLASDAAAYITGETVNVNGGMYMA